MKIYFDYKIFHLQKYGGISNYFLKLYEEIYKLNPEIRYICPIYKNVLLNKTKNKKISGMQFKYLPSQLNLIFEKYNQVLSNKLISSNNKNIIHETYYSKYDDYKNFKGKRFCTVFDMINEKFPKYFKNNKWITEIKKRTILRSDHIFCISETTKNDLINYFNISEKKITTTLLASTINKNIKLYEKKKFENCFLFVGSRSGYKNFDRLLKAFSISKNLRKNYKIIFFGGEILSSRELNLIKELRMNDGVLFYNDNHYDLLYLYQNVKCLIFPSLYEGFGLPILEAMSVGCPVLSSDGGSLREVGGDSCIYFDPMDIEQIKDVCENFVNSEKLIPQFILKGYTRSKKFSWQKCASLTFEKYNNL